MVKCTNLACPLEKLYLLVSATDIWVLLLPQQNLAFLANSFHWILCCPVMSHCMCSKNLSFNLPHMQPGVSGLCGKVREVSSTVIW